MFDNEQQKRLQSNTPTATLFIGLKLAHASTLQSIAQEETVENECL